MRKVVLRFILFACFMLTINNNAFAKLFANQYCQFELPPGWECALEGTEWVCQAQSAARKKEAIIILAAKIRGSQDGLSQYQTYLKETKTFTLPGGKTQVSEPKYNKKSTINSHPWIDALHLASEVPGFYTRYLATVKADLGVAVTFSVGKNYYDDYRELFDRVVATLRVFRQTGVDPGTYVGVKSKEEDLLGESEFIDAQFRDDIAQKKRKRGGGMFGDQGGLLIFIILGGVGFFVMMKLKKGKKKKVKKKVKKKEG